LVDILAAHLFTVTVQHQEVAFILGPLLPILLKFVEF